METVNSHNLLHRVVPSARLHVGERRIRSVRIHIVEHNRPPGDKLPVEKPVVHKHRERQIVITNVRRSPSRHVAPQLRVQPRGKHIAVQPAGYHPFQMHHLRHIAAARVAANAIHPHLHIRLGRLTVNQHRRVRHHRRSPRALGKSRRAILHPETRIKRTPVPQHPHTRAVRGNLADMQPRGRGAQRGGRLEPIPTVTPRPHRAAPPLRRRAHRVTRRVHHHHMPRVQHQPDVGGITPRSAGTIDHRQRIVLLGHPDLPIARIPAHILISHLHHPHLAPRHPQIQARRLHHQQPRRVPVAEQTARYRLDAPHTVGEINLGSRPHLAAEQHRPVGIHHHLVIVPVPNRKRERQRDRHLAANLPRRAHRHVHPQRRVHTRRKNIIVHHCLPAANSPPKQKTHSQKNKAPHSQFSILNSQFSILNSQFP